MVVLYIHVHVIMFLDSKFYSIFSVFVRVKTKNVLCHVYTIHF